MRAETLARLGELGYSSYSEYLRSPLWAANKSRLNLPCICFICPKTTHLHAHHCSYDNIGNEQEGDLIKLCDTHHKAIHRLVNKGCSLRTAHLEYKKKCKSRPVRDSTAKTNKKSIKSYEMYAGQRKKPRSKGRSVGKSNEKLHRIQAENRGKQNAARLARGQSTLSGIETSANYVSKILDSNIYEQDLLSKANERLAAKNLT